MRVAVYGSGGHGKVVADILSAGGEHDFVGFLDDTAKEGHRIGGHPIIPVTEELDAIASEWEIEGVALGVGDNDARYRLAERVRRAGLALVTAVHPAATLAPSVAVGEGVVIMAGCIVNPYTELEEGVVVNTAASVDHDCRVRRYAHIWPGARLAGNVGIGEFSYIGMGASILQNLRIGARVTVGAGAVVLHDLEDDITVVGVPARKIRG